MRTKANGAAEATSAEWRFKLGAAIIALAFAIWLSIPLGKVMDASAGEMAGLTGGVFIANKLFLLLAIAIMGKPGFRQLKGHLFGYVSGLAPNATVGPFRYRIGLTMFCLPLVSAIVEPYVEAIAPGLWPDSWQLELFGDIVLIASFFVLGGNFWDKVRALFVRTATVVDMGDKSSRA